MPRFDVVPSAVEGCLEALWECQAPLHDCLARREPRTHCCDSLVGQCSTLERQAIEPMALQGEGGPLRGMPRCISEVTGEEEPRGWHSHPLVADEMGEPEGVLMCDASGVVNKGQDSVGGARQSGGSLGQGEHGQGGVWAASASRQG
jgi:hypothetical protein